MEFIWEAGADLLEQQLEPLQEASMEMLMLFMDGWGFWLIRTLGGIVSDSAWSPTAWLQLFYFEPENILAMADLLALLSMIVGRPLRWCSGLWRAWAPYEREMAVDGGPIRIDLFLIAPIVALSTILACFIAVVS